VPADLSVTVAGLELKNPIMAGSGEATMSEEGILAALDAGAAAVVAKSVNESEAARRQLDAAEYVLLDPQWRPLPWGPAPRTASLFCRSGLAPESFERWVERIAACDEVARQRDAYVVGSLIVSEIASAVDMARRFVAAGVRWIELNVGTPHAEEAAPGALRAAGTAAGVADLVAPVRDAVSVPVTVKLSGEGDPLAAADAAWRADADAVCLAGRHLGFLPDPGTRRPVLGTFGAIGGPWALPLTLRWIAKARQAFGPDRSIVGTNGARSAEDVVRFLLTGASAVQMTSSVVTDGPGALTAAIRGVEAYLSEQHVAARAIIGEATDHVMTYEEVAGA
jgi:dihydroorotate dehydrogenase (NAD+) catalytic subunit